MAFVINHAPASIAMSLAQQAGQGDRVMREAQLRDQQMRQQMALSEQAQRQRAFEISSALDARRLQTDDLRYQDQRQQQAFQNDLSLKKFGLDANQFEYGQQNDAARQAQLVAEMAERARQHNEELAYKNKQLETVDWYNRQKTDMGFGRLEQGDRRLDQQQQYWSGLLGQNQQKIDVSKQGLDMRRDQFGQQQDFREQQWRESEANRVSSQLKRIMTEPTYGTPKPLPGMEALAKKLTQRLMELEGFDQPAPQQQPLPGQAPAAMPGQQPMSGQAPQIPWQKGEVFHAPDGRKIAFSGQVHAQKPEPGKLGDGDILIAPDGSYLVWDARIAKALTID